VFSWQCLLHSRNQETNSYENGLESVDFNEADDNNTTTISFPNNENSICMSTPSEHPKVNMASTPDFQTCNDPQRKQDYIERRNEIISPKRSSAEYDH
jgi:hypothetical protein